MVAITLGPAVLDIAGVRAGDRNQIQITLTVAGERLDLTDAEVTAQARARVTDIGEPALTAEVVVVDAVNGVVTVAWPGEQVRTVLAETATWTGVWDMQVATTGVDPITVVAGSIKTELDVTR